MPICLLAPSIEKYDIFADRNRNLVRERWM